jgi:hypothetical protein
MGRIYFIKGGKRGGFIKEEGGFVKKGRIYAGGWRLFRN